MPLSEEGDAVAPPCEMCIRDSAFDLKIADIARDGQLLQYVRAIAEDIVEHDPGAQSPENEIPVSYTHLRMYRCSGCS